MNVAGDGDNSAPGDVRVRRGAADRLRQARPGRLRARAAASSASRSSRPAAPPRRSPTRASRRARSRTTPASPRSSTAASRRSTRASTPACSRSARTPSTSRRSSSRRSSRSTSSASTSTRSSASRGRRGVDEDEVIENIDIGGPTLIRAAAKNHRFAAVVVSPESYDAVLEELRVLRRPPRGGDARGARARGVRLHRPLRRRDRALVRRARGGLPGQVTRVVRQGARPLLRREPAPARRLLRRRAAPAPTCCRWSRSCTARSCRSTTCSTSTPAAAWSRSSSCRPR